MAFFSPGLGIYIKGVVQGVGFRPFVYRLALRYKLTGSVRNTGEGVYVTAYGKPETLEGFLKALKDEAPPLARLDQIQIQPLYDAAPQIFTVLESRSDNKKTKLPPDIATCQACLHELFDPQDRRYRYPFINCTDCGPRYSVVEDLPYDRQNTTLKRFPLCPACLQEYSDPGNRRFHAEPIACPQCGPKIWLVDPSGKEITGEDPLLQAVKALKEGKILALRGLGGFHLVVEATNEQGVQRLRQRKQRPRKPLAIMVPDLKTAEELVHLSSTEKDALLSFRSPIVLAEKRPSSLAPSLAPGLSYLGLMLPYTPLHHLLFREGGFRALVMTSGNLSGTPLCFRNEEALKRLRKLADLFLLHDREIVIGIDDSVVREIGGKIRLIRRARGYVPEALPFPTESPPILAVGPLLKNTFCLTREKEAFVSQHIGDLDNLETENFFRQVLRHLQRLLEVSPRIVACDLHPGYLSTILAEEWARKFKCPLIKVPHHVAHAAAVMGEFGLERTLALILDGLGLGTDGTLWGGEILLVEHGHFERLAHLEAVPQPGGDAAAREPWRMALAYLYRVFGDQALPWAQRLLGASIPQKTLESILTAIKKGLHSPLTSACGRLFDACAALLGLCLRNSFEAEAPMLLECLAARASNERQAYPLPFSNRILKTTALVKALLEDYQREIPPETIAFKIHQGLALGFTQALLTLSQETGVRNVVFSGGCFQNALLSQLLDEHLRERGLRVFWPERLPLNDGGLAYGQALWAAWIYKRQ